MNQEPLVSCIIIFFNAGEQFFIEAIESIFAQTYDNWELLLVDDGSTDESTAIALQYAHKNPKKVYYLQHEGHQNRGMSAARNLGIYHAKGEYIALLDADDVWLPQKLEKQVTILEAQPEAAMVYGSTLMWYGWTGNPEDTKYNYRRSLGIKPNTLVKSPTLLKLFLKGKGNTPATCGVLMRRELCNYVGGFEESFPGMFEDQAFFYKVALNANVYVESDYWDKYRQHSNSSCHIAAAQGHYNTLYPNKAQLKFLNWVEKYLSEQNVDDIEIWQAFQKALWPYKYKKLYHSLQLFRASVKTSKRALNLIAKQFFPKLFIHG